MTINVNHEEVAKTLAFEIADLKYQVAAYKNLVSQFEQEAQRAREVKEDGGLDEPDTTTA